MEISDIPVPQVVKELLKSCQCFLRGLGSAAFFFLLAVSLAEIISEKLQAVKTNVHHVVIIKMTVQRKPIILEKSTML